MATLSYFLRSKSDNASIYCRLTINRQTQFEKKTGLTINRNNWSNTTKLPLQKADAEIKGIKSKLEGLKVYVQNKANQSILNGELITSNWLGHSIDVYFGLASETGKDDSVLGAFDRYIEKLKQDGKAVNTIKKYQYARKKFLIFQGQDKYRVKDIDGFFADRFLNELNLGKSTANKILRNVVTVCKSARDKYGIEASKTLNGIETKRAIKTHKIHLEPKELLKIEKAHIVSDYLLNARKWLLLSCEIGIRISDTNKINEENIVEYEGMRFLQFMPTKQRKDRDNIMVTIPIVGKVKELLSDGFPRPISHQKLNDYVKKVCEIAEIDEPTKGEKRLVKNGLNVEGIYPKWQLITFHCGRYSFITNSKNIINNQMIRTITGHKSDRMLENYQINEHLKDAKIVGEILEQKYKERQAPLAVNE